MVNPDLWYQVGYGLGELTAKYGPYAAKLLGSLGIAGATDWAHNKYLQWRYGTHKNVSMGNIYPNGSSSSLSYAQRLRQMVRYGYYYKRRYYNSWARRKYGIRKALRTAQKSLYYKFDAPIVFRWTQATGSATSKVVKEYINDDGDPSSTTNADMTIHDLLQPKVRDLMRMYTMGRLRGIALHWTPNITGLLTNSSFPLISVHPEYPKQSVVTTYSYMQSLDKENILICGALKQWKYTKYFLKYDNMDEFLNEFEYGRIKFSEDLTNASMPTGTVLGTLVCRFYIQYKGNKN